MTDVSKYIWILVETKKKKESLVFFLIAEKFKSFLNEKQKKLNKVYKNARWQLSLKQMFLILFKIKMKP